MDGYQEEGLTYADLNPQTIMLSDGVRSRKTATGYVVEVMGNDEHWHAITATDWNSDTKFNAGTIVLDRGGQWKALVANTDSRPVSGNTDWELVGGLPYVDVVLDPVQLTTPPFTTSLGTTPGVPVLDAPGEGLIVVPRFVDTLPSLGDAWGTNANAKLSYTDSDGEIWAEGIVFDGLSDTAGNDSGFSNPWRTYPHMWDQDQGYLPGGFQFIVNDENGVVNAPLVLTTDNDVTNGGATFGTRSLTYRIYYDIVAVLALPSTFFHITAIDQGTKTITVNGDASALTGLIAVVGSTGNDGSYTIVSATFDTDHTDIVVSEAVPDDTADGWVKQ